jgi:hypothetical protein
MFPTRIDEQFLALGKVTAAVELIQARETSQKKAAARSGAR